MSQRTPNTFSPNDPSSAGAYPPSRTALLLCDYQNIIISLLGDRGAATVPIAAALRTWAKKHNILTLHSTIDLTATPDPSNRVASRIAPMKAKITSQPALAEEHPSIAITAEASNAPNNNNAPNNEIHLPRPAGKISALSDGGGPNEQPNSLRSTLHAHNIKSVIVAGLSSSGVVLSTVRQLSDEGFVVTVVEDACADRTEEVQRVVMDVVLAPVSCVEKGEGVMRGLEGVWVG